MSERAIDADSRREHLISLNRLEVALGCVVTVISLLGCVGSWYILPYRVAAVEVEQKAIALKFDSGVREAAIKMEAVQRSAENTRELLIRIDERLKQVQSALKIPTQP